MGCGTTKEKLQTDILVLQLEKAEIQEERERLIHQLKLLSHKREYSKITNICKNSNREKASRNLQDLETQKSDNN